VDLLGGYRRTGRSSDRVGVHGLGVGPSRYLKKDGRSGLMGEGSGLNDFLWGKTVPVSHSKAGRETPTGPR